MAKVVGIIPIYFRPKSEGPPKNHVKALFDAPGCRLRLYCIVIEPNIIILGGGGTKNSGKLQNYPKLLEQNNLINYISKGLLSHPDLKTNQKGLLNPQVFTI
jgi:hypothetical protein